jgi:hypothetical protein
LCGILRYGFMAQWSYERHGLECVGRIVALGAGIDVFVQSAVWIQG